MKGRRIRKDEINTSDIRFYDEHHLSSKLGIERRKFHREIKPIIISDHSEILKEIQCDNPDIGLDSNHDLYLANPARTLIKKTDSNIFDYI